MLRRTSLVFRLLVMVFMALGLGTLMSSSAAAQSSQTGICQQVVGGDISQSPELECTITIDDDGSCQLLVNGNTFQNVQGCGLNSCPQQIILENGDIFQFQCDDDGVTPTPVTPTPVTPTPVTPTPVTPTPVTVTPTPVTVTPTPVTPGVTVTPTPETPGVTVTPTPVTPGATVTPTPVTPDDDDDDDGGQANPPDDDDGDDDGGQAEEPMEVSVLPDTGQGPDSGQSNSANMLLLGAMGAILTLGAVAMRMRGNR